MDIELISKNYSKKNLNQTSMSNRYEQYTLLPSSKFTVANSARKLREPYYYLQKEDKLIPSPYMRELAIKYKIIGYTLNAPIVAKYPYVAILFEHSETFQRVWYHFNLEL
jgi:hypothetical protein